MLRKGYILAISFILISLNSWIFVQGQEGSRNIMEEYCLKNWINDLVQCADYLPEDYEERKDEYHAQEAEKMRQEILGIQEEQETKLDCPPGSHLTTDSQGFLICADSTEEFIKNPSTKSEFELGELGGYGLVAVIAIVAIIIGIVAITKNRGGRAKEHDYPDVKGHSFSNDTKEQVIGEQFGRCAMCGVIPNHWEFDYIHGRGDNSVQNCQGLCQDCHHDKIQKENF